MSEVTGRIALSEPITYTIGSGDDARQETVTELIVKSKITAGDLMAMDAHSGEVAKMLALIAQVTGQPFIVAKSLSIADFTAVMVKVEGFIPPGLLTGETPLAT